MEQPKGRGTKTRLLFPQPVLTSLQAPLDLNIASVENVQALSK